MEGAQLVDANVTLRVTPLGVRKKTADTDPTVLALVEEWRLARRAGNRLDARILAGKIEDARAQARRQ